MSEEKNYRMRDLVRLLDSNKGRVFGLIDRYREFIEINGEKNWTSYPESTLATLKLIMKLIDEGKSTSQIKTYLSDTKTVETPPSTGAATVFDTLLKSGQLRIAIDVNVRIVRD